MIFHSFCRHRGLTKSSIKCDGAVAGSLALRSGTYLGRNNLADAVFLCFRSDLFEKHEWAQGKLGQGRAVHRALGGHDKLPVMA